jgi:EAL domain-containing protein (putative c-di-GMP-specific phosphodiesterase class I)
MKTPPSSTNELFVVRTGRLARARGRRRKPEQPVAPSSAATTTLLHSGQDREQRIQRVRHTIDHRTLDTLLQPIVDLNNGHAVGAEALSRFREPPLRSPSLWFAEATSLGLGVELEMTAVRLALEQLRRLPSGLYLSLNASVDTIMSEEFGVALADVPAERIVLELTEHSRVGDYTRLSHTLEDLRARGVRLAVDDAGAGYASFRHVLNLHPDLIKLDIGLTRGIDQDPARRALGSALLTFGLDAIKASIVAEGIETKGELDTLRVLGCPFGQGFYLGRPGRLRVANSAARASTVLWLPEEETTSTTAPSPAAGVLYQGGPARNATVAQVIQIESPRPHEDGSETYEAATGAADKRRTHDNAEFLALVAEIKELQQADKRALVG